MNRKIQVLIYGTEDESVHTVGLLQSVPGVQGYEHNCKHVKEWEEFQIQLVEWEPNLIIVLKDGAAGMEGVILARNSRPQVPLFWFSDDNGFGVQSHRLECDYFAVKPVLQEKIDKAFHRCASLGVSF